MTPKQASRALSALDNALYRNKVYREIAHVDDLTTVWEREAIFRLRGHLIAMIPESELRAVTPTSEPLPSKENL